AHRDRAEVVGHERIAALCQRRGQRRFSCPRQAAEQHRLAVHAHRAGVQHDLLALMQQYSEHSAEEEYANVACFGAGLWLEYDLAPIAEQEARNVRDPHEKPPVGDLPRGAGGAGIFESPGYRSAPDRHVERTGIGHQGDQARQRDLAADRQPGNAIEMHCRYLFRPPRSLMPELPAWRGDLERFTGYSPFQTRLFCGDGGGNNTADSSASARCRPGHAAWTGMELSAAARLEPKARAS